VPAGAQAGYSALIERSGGCSVAVQQMARQEEGIRDHRRHDRTADYGRNEILLLTDDPMRQSEKCRSRKSLAKQAASSAVAVVRLV
jgi:hypothetical protein